MAIAINIKCDKDYTGDLNELLRAFAPYLVIGDENTAEIKFTDTAFECGAKNNTEITLKYNGELKYRVNFDAKSDMIKQKSEEKRHAKIMLYDLFSTITGRELPYGSLTGIRPTKLYREIERTGKDARDYFVDSLSVSPNNADFIKQIVDNQRKIYLEDAKTIDLFVNIPICVTRCSYCSFISAEYGKIKKLITPYVNQLKREIEESIAIINTGGYKLRAIYVGGGTPTSLNADDFRVIMETLKCVGAEEFTVEAGRPDTITKEKLQIMADSGVSRISVNPQSFNDKTLEIIGRSHTAEDIIKCYKLAREYPFDINMDLIAMLPNENFDDFKYSLDKCIELRPDNITVHTLALKKGSALKLSEYTRVDEDTAERMTEYSRFALADADYQPYYMYRQKYMSGNLENAGYALKGKECIYNIDIMEESLGIIANGAGGISKRIFASEGRLERLANPKGIDVYLEREEKIKIDKANFFKF